MALQGSCPNCFSPLKGQEVCPCCGYDISKEKKYIGILPSFTILKERYLIGRVLGRGGFGITYLAMDIYRNQCCAIKEYMPSEYSVRSNGALTVTPKSETKAQAVFKHGREKFLEEAQTLSKLQDNPIVVDILDYFEQNNTAYLVMEYLDGTDLKEAAKANGGKLDPDYAKTVFVTVASSLMAIHEKKILHRDLSPDNIVVTTDRRIKLIDFGAARSFVSDQNNGMSILLKPGFAPPEQYEKKGNQGPWSDVYALCATFYKLVSGQAVVDASFRGRGEKLPTLSELGVAVSKKTSDVIEKGLVLDYKKRYQNFKELLDDIDMPAPRVQAQPQPNPEHHAATEPQPEIGPGPQTERQVYDKPDAKHGFFSRFLKKDRKENESNGIVQVRERPLKPNAAGTPDEIRPLPVDKRASMPQKQENKPDKQMPYVAAVMGNKIYKKATLSKEKELLIGRSEERCQLVISGDQNVSRVHCKIRFDGMECFITDLSSNGTYLDNGIRLTQEESRIKPGTRFYLATPVHMLIICY